MSAQFADALLGYEFYLEHKGEVSRREINAHLNRLERAEIAPRTYAHYRNLMDYGFMTYIPINKFDVFRSLGKLQMAADRRRYTRWQTNISARIYRSDRRSVECTIIDRSLVGFGIRTSARFPLREGSMVWVDMDGYDPIPCLVAWREHEENKTRLGLRATEFIENYRAVPELVDYKRPYGLLLISRDGDDEIDWNYLVGVLEVSTELIDAIDDLLHVIGQTSGREPNLRKPILRSIEFNSPGAAEIKIDFGIADIIRALFEYLETIGLRRKRYRVETEQVELANEARRIENEGHRIENDMRMLDLQRKRLETRNLQIEVMRNAISMKPEDVGLVLDGDAIAVLLRESLKRALGLDELPENLFAEDSLERGILVERVMRAVVKLLNGDDPSYQVLATTESPEESV